MKATGTITSAEIIDDPGHGKDRAVVHANDIVVDVIANPDGTIYVECYAYPSETRAVVQHAAIDPDKDMHPNLQLGLEAR